MAERTHRRVLKSTVSASQVHRSCQRENIGNAMILNLNSACASQLPSNKPLPTFWDGGCPSSANWRIPCSTPGSRFAAGVSMQRGRHPAATPSRAGLRNTAMRRPHCLPTSLAHRSRPVTLLRQRRSRSSRSTTRRPMSRWSTNGFVARWVALGSRLPSTSPPGVSSRGSVSGQRRTEGSSMGKGRSARTRPNRQFSL